MNHISRIAELFPRNTLQYHECVGLSRLIDRNHAEGGLYGVDRETFDDLLAKAEGEFKLAMGTMP